MLCRSAPGLRLLHVAAGWLQTQLRKESEWMSKQPKARATKEQARIENFYKLQEQARSGPARDRRVSFGDMQMARQGKKVLVMEARAPRSPSALTVF